MSCFEQGPCGPPQREMQVDPLRVDAHNLVRELYAPDQRMHGQAINEMARETRNLDPYAAERFVGYINQETQGRSPIREVPETVRDQYGVHGTGRELLVMSDPYSQQQQVLNVVPRHEQQRPVVIGRPGIDPLTGLEIGAGAVITHEVLRDIFHHR